MAKPLILGIVGEKSSGKSVVFQHLKGRPGVLALRFSDIVNEILRDLKLNYRDRAVQGRLAEALRHTLGDGVMVRALMARAADSRKRLVVLDGIRKIGELEEFRKYARAKVVYITAPYEIRWQRARARRQRKDDVVSLKRFIQIEKTFPAEIEIPAVGRKADVRLDNIGTQAELFSKVEAVIRRFGVKV